MRIPVAWRPTPGVSVRRPPCAGGQRLALPVRAGGEPERVVVQGYGQLGQVGVTVGERPVPGAVRPLPRWWPAPRPAAPPPTSRSAWLRTEMAKPGRCVSYRSAATSARRSATASSLAASASACRPVSASRSDWLCSDAARWGRWASRSAATNSRCRATACSLAGGERLGPPPGVCQSKRVDV